MIKTNENYESSGKVSVDTKTNEQYDLKLLDELTDVFLKINNVLRCAKLPTADVSILEIMYKNLMMDVEKQKIRSEDFIRSLKSFLRGTESFPTYNQVLNRCWSLEVSNRPEIEQIEGCAPRDKVLSWFDKIRKDNGFFTILKKGGVEK